MKDQTNNNPNEISGAERITEKPRDRTDDEVEEWSHYAPWLLDQFPCAVWRSDKNGKCDYVNRAWLDLRGRTMEQELGDGWTEGVHPDDLDFCLKTYFDAFNTRQAFEIEYRLRSHEGEYRWMNDCGRPFSDLEGNFGGYVGTCFDITERKRDEESLRLFRSLLDRSSDAIEVLDPYTLRFRDCNESACQCLGYSREEFLTLSVFDIDSKINESRAAAVAAEIKRSGFAMYESIHRRRDGSTFPVEVNVREIQLERTYRVAVVRDITERKQAEKSLREYERVVEGLEEMIAVVDRDYRYLIANRAFLKHRGMERKQVIGHYVSEILDPEIFEKVVRQKLDECFQGRIVEYELRYTYPKLGERDLLVSYFPIEGPAGVDRVASVLQDITERKRAEEALRETEQKYRDIFENAGEGIFQSTPGGRFISANPALARMHGFDSPDELIRDRKDITREVYVDRNRRAEFKRLLDEHGIVRGFEYQIFRRDGSKIWISVNARAVSDKQGAILYYEGTAQDINDRKRAEARSAAFAAVARKLSGARTPLDAGRIIARTAADLSEWDFFDLNLYDADRDLVHPMLNIDTIDGQRTETTALVSERKPTARSRRVIDHGPELRLREEPIQFDADAIPFGDKTRPSASLMTVPIRHADSVIGLLSLQSYSSHSYDTAALGDLQALADHCGEALNRIRGEQLLFESRERYRELFENAKDAIYVHDLSGRYTSVNRAAEQLSGFTREEILGKHFSKFVLPRDLKHVRTNLCKKLDEENETIYEVDLVRRDGQRVPVEVSSRLIFENGVAVGVQGVVRDITDRKRAQDALRTYSQRLIQAQEVERAKIARELHDEIGQVLTAVRINLQSIQRSWGTAECVPPLDESIGIVDEALGRVRELSVELRPALLDDLGLSAALGWYVDRYAQRTGIIATVLSGFEDDARLPRELETACFRIAQEALTNVARHAQAVSVSVQLERSRERMLLTIMDDGVGFDIDDLRKRASAASALGLRGMEERALTVGGYIEIDSGSGLGTRIRATFPFKRR